MFVGRLASSASQLGRAVVHLSISIWVVNLGVSIDVVFVGAPGASVDVGVGSTKPLPSLPSLVWL